MEGAAQEQTLYSESTKRKIADDFEIAKQKALEVAARLNSGFEAKRPRFDSPTASLDGASSNSTVSQSSYPVFTPPTSQYNGSQGTSKKIRIPNGKVGVIIGRGGEMIKTLQLRSGAKIQITRDADADPTSGMRDVELVGTADQISRAEQQINEVIAETDAVGSGGPSGNRPINPVQPGAEQFVMKIPNEKVAMIIGKGGETIKSMQHKSGARIQVVPLHPPPGDTSTERSVYISGSQEQIDSAKELINDVMSGNRPRTYSGSTGYTQASYPPSGGWAPQGQPPVQHQQQQAYGYGNQGSYAMPPPPYYGGYPPQQPTWDQSNSSTVPPQPQQDMGYNAYGQQPGQVTSTPPSGAYNYSQAPPTSAYNYNQGYPQQPSSYGQENSTQPPPAGSEQQQQYADPNSAYTQPPPASSQPDSTAAATQPPQPGYSADSGTSQAYATGYSQPATAAPTNGYGTYPGYGAPPPSYNHSGYPQTGYEQQQGAQASYPYYGQNAYPPAQASYYQGGYPPAPGQPPSYGAEKTDDGNSAAGSAAKKESES